MKKIEVVFTVMDLFNSGCELTLQEITERAKCSKASTQRAIYFLRKKRNMPISYDYLRRVYFLGQYEKLTKQEIDKRTKEKNALKIAYKKKLYRIFGNTWRDHYQEGGEYEI